MDKRGPDDGRAAESRKISWASAFGGAIALTALLVTGHAAWTHDSDTDMAILVALMLGFALVLLAMVLLYARLRETHRQAKQTETAFKMAVQSLSDGFAIIDGDGRVVLSNDRLRAMLPDQHDLDALRDLATHDEEQHLDDGRWVLHRAHDLPDGGKAIVYTDISALKRREQAILDHASRYRDMVERSPIPIYVHRERIVVYANTATARVLGYGTPGDIVGKNIFDLVHPDHHKLLQRRLKQVADLNERLNQVDMQYVRKDGTPIHTEAQVSPVVFDGEPALESTLYDVSARRTAERAMRESEQRYRNLFELSPDAIIVHDGKSILFANDTAAQMFGAERDIDLFGMDIENLQGGSADDCTLAVTDGAATGPSAQQTCRLHRLDGEPFDAEIVVAPTPHHGQIVQQAVIRDVTRRKRMDAAMTQNAKLAALGGMVAGLAHELSQPLNIMRFAAEGGLLKMAKGTIDDAGHAKNYHLVQDQAERMAQVMDNMRIFSRKETRPMGTFDLALAVRNICHLVRNPFRVDDVHIQTEGPVSGIWATGSAIQFEQVMLNLLTNARDSILEHRHRLDLDEPGRITIELRDADDDIAVSVTDNGSGISAEHLSNLFDPFFTTKEAGKGTGLGLAISHEIITAMSGTMDVRNTGDGARFTVHLPRQAANDETAPPADAPGESRDGPQEHDTKPGLPRAPRPAQPDVTPAPTAARTPDQPRGRVLIVEDEVEAAHAMAEFLREEGFDVSLAHNGREGLTAYLAQRPDIVVTDIRMPGMNGTDLIAALRRERADLPIIAVTGHMGGTEPLAHDGDALAVKVLAKPVSLRTLSHEIDRICAA